MTDSARETKAAGFRADIQGLRAVAVLAVILNHAGIPAVSGGYVGVDVFFVISGFLITGHLARSLERDGRIGFATFYARRARRILPASLTVLLLSVLGALVLVPPLLREQIFRDAIATAFYVPNYSFAVQGTDYLADSTPSLFQHYWSLGVEEQFYLVWPLLLFGVYLLSRRVSRGSRRASRGARRWMIGVLSIVIVASFAASVALTFSSEPWAFFSLWSRAWELGLGGIVALAPGATRWLRPVVAAVLGWLGLAGILAACFLFSATTAFPGWADALPVASAALLIFAGAVPARFGPSLLLTLRPLQFIGLISYSIYLVHWPILVLVQARVGYYNPLPVWGTTLLVAASIPVAWLLYRFVENPARRATWLIHSVPRTLIGAGAASIVIAVVAVVAIAVTTALPLNSGRTTALSAPTDPPTATPFVPSNLRPSIQTAGDDNPAIYAQGCEVGIAQTAPNPCEFGAAGGQRIVLFGDSHAAQWFPALQKIAAEGSYQLETQTKSGCASVDIDIARNGVDYMACNVWRAKVIAQLKADPPALVVMANYTNPDFTNAANATAQWEAGMMKTIDELTPVTKVAVIADTPDLRYSPIICLSAHLTSARDCGQPASLALKSPGRPAEQDVASVTSATLIDLTGYFCADGWCPAIDGSTLIYRDSHHITATYSAELASALAPRIRALMG
ncbi:MAG TPA: acyltransferase family protein [Galbitalea sp.]